MLSGNSIQFYVYWPYVICDVIFREVRPRKRELNKLIPSLPLAAPCEQNKITKWSPLIGYTVVILIIATQ